MIEELNANFGNFFEAPLIEEIAANGTFVEFKEGKKIIEIGEYIKGTPLLISGVIKILSEDNEGYELLLYYLEKGDTCSMTMITNPGETKSNIRAIAETDVALIIIPVRKTEEWSAKYKSWRDYIFNNYHDRLNELLAAVDSIAFKNMDERLLNYLKEKSRVANSKIIVNTHQEIAYDLHSSRVVISRLLKKLEVLGKINLHRNQIEIIEL